MIVMLCLLMLSACSQWTVEYKEPSQSLTEATQSNSIGKSHYPLTLTVYDDAGKEVQQTIEKEPKRIVVIGQGFAEWMLAFGEEKRIVGLAYLDKSFSEYEEQIKKTSYYYGYVAFKRGYFGVAAGFDYLDVLCLPKRTDWGYFFLEQEGHTSTYWNQLYYWSHHRQLFLKILRI